MINLDNESLFDLDDDVAIEGFEDGALIFLCRQMRIIDVNSSSYMILDCINQRKSLSEIISLFSTANAICTDLAKDDVSDFIVRMSNLGVVKNVLHKECNQSEELVVTKRYMAYPDIWIRRDLNGALLYKPDKKEFNSINLTGALIWDFIKAFPRTEREIIDHVMENCDSVTLSEMKFDLNDFIFNLIEKGFVEEISNES